MTAQACTDWAALIAELRRRGFPISTLSRELSIPRSTLGYYAYNGGQPKHTEGERLVAYWCQVTGNAREKIPVTAVALSAAALGRIDRQVS